MRTAICLLALAACAETTPLVIPSFATPTGLAVASFYQPPKDSDPCVLEPRGWRHGLFVANAGEDALQLVKLGADLAKLDFVYGDTHYFPLRIPAGSAPTDLGATRDGAFVVILDAVTESLRLVDTGNLRIVKSDATHALEVPLGPPGSRPTALVSTAVDCGENCRGRFYVAMAGTGTILELELRATANGPYAGFVPPTCDATEGLYSPVAVVPTRSFDVGGAPVALSVDRTGTMLYASDAMSHDVLRLELASGLVDRRDVGVTAGPLAVSADGALLVVGRPEWRDLLVLEDAAGPGFGPLDADPVVTPLPACLRDCASLDPNVCVGTHPADQALCLTADGLGATAQAYPGIYLAHVPAKILALGEVPEAQQALAGAGEPVLDNPCDDEARSYAQYALVAAIDGRVSFVGLRQTSADPPSPTLVASNWCKSRSAKAVTIDTSIQASEQEEVASTLATLLGPCPAHPTDRRRFACVSDDQGDAPGGVLVMSGNPPPEEIRFRWEGVLPRLDRQPGAGEIALVEVPVINAATGLETGGTRALAAFTDLALDLGDAEIRPRELGPGYLDPYGCDAAEADVLYRGDILDIASTPLGDDECRAGLADNPARCNLERRIVKAETDADGRTHLFTCPPLTPIVSCFRGGGVIAYQIRAGDQFVVSFGTPRPERLGPGDLLRPYHDPFDRRPVGLQLRSFDTQAAAGACERYDEDGRPKIMDPILSRASVWVLRVSDAFTVVETGDDPSSADAGAVAGLAPAAMIISPFGGPDSLPVTFISYSASNALLGFVGSDATSARQDVGRYSLLK